MIKYKITTARFTKKGTINLTLSNRFQIVFHKTAQICIEGDLPIYLTEIDLDNLIGCSFSLGVDHATVECHTTDKIYNIFYGANPTTT